MRIMHQLVRAAGLALLALSFVSGAQAAVKIAVLLPFSSSLGLVAESQKFGVLMAVEEINAKPSRLGRIEVIFNDDQMKPDVAAFEAKKLIDLEKIQFIVGAPFSASAAAIAPIAHASKVLLITTGLMDESAKVRSDNLALWFHIGTDIEAVRSGTRRVQDSTKFVPAATCLLGQSPQMKDTDDFAVCPMGFSTREAWEKFQRSAAEAIRKDIGGMKAKSDHINVATAISYTAIKVLYEAMDEVSQTGPDPEKTASILQTKKFDTVFGTKTFGTKHQILTTPILFANPVRKSGPSFDSFFSKLKAEVKDKCDDCKKNGDCPQGAVSPLAAEDECCKKTSDCPQGMILR
jgi:ABC-type branched-subunit amino acid transport system substrate-binding protein